MHERRTPISMKNLINSFKLWRTTPETRIHGGYIALAMQNMQEFKNIQRPNYNHIACVGGWFCLGLHDLEVSWRDDCSPSDE